ncbi:MAG: response regulator [Anaerolineae bacterium]
MSHYPAVLYVEDDPQSREIMYLLLVDQMGLENVTIYEDSTDFMDRIMGLNPKPDVILLDIHMRPYTGFDMLEMLRNHEDFRDTPIVALTASVMNEEVYKLKTAGFSGVIAKPLDLDAFPQILDRILHSETVWYVVS